MFLRSRYSLVVVIVGLIAGSTVAQDAVPTRDEIPEQYKWDLTRIYASTAAWEAEHDRCAVLIERLSAGRGDTFDSAAHLSSTPTTVARTPPARVRGHLSASLS